MIGMVQDDAWGANWLGAGIQEALQIEFFWHGRTYPKISWSEKTYVQI